MPDINQKKDRLEHGRFMKVALDHLPPCLFFLLRNLGVSITRKIHQIYFPVDIVKVDRLGLSRRRGNPGKGFPVHQRIDQRRFSYV